MPVAAMIASMSAIDAGTSRCAPSARKMPPTAILPVSTRRPSSDGGRMSSARTCTIMLCRTALLRTGRVGDQAQLVDATFTHKRHHLGHEAVGHVLVGLQVELALLLQPGVGRERLFQAVVRDLRFAQKYLLVLGDGHQELLLFDVHPG